MILRRLTKAACLALCLASPAPALRAGEAADAARQFLEAGRFVAGVEAMEKRLAAAPGDGEARLGLGFLRLGLAIQHLGEAQYRYGLRPPQGLGVPFLRLPVPANANPDEVTYEKQRAVLQTLLDDLAAVDAALEPLADGAVKLPLDIPAIRFDFTGAADPAEATRFDAIMNALAGGRPGAPTPRETFEIAFDRSDALWLRGYSRLLSANLEFLLAYDWHETFESAGQLFYPRIAPQRMPAPTAEDLRQMQRGFLGDSHAIADAIALVHQIRWPLAEPARMSRARAHLKAVVALSRQTWDSILAETDDDREWIPSPKQQNGALGLPVTEAQVATWRVALDEFDAALDGRRLIPHWRFARGVDLRRFFEEPRAFDLVLIATGHAVVPYLADGPVISAETWRQWERAFGGNFLMYAMWFN